MKRLVFQTKSGKSLLTGMYVRVPVDTDQPDGEFRDFRIGQVTDIDELAGVVKVKALTYSLDQPPIMVTVESPLSWITRCRILPDTEFTHA